MRFQSSNRQSTVDIDALSLDELRAYINGLRERRQALINDRCDGVECDRCILRRSCGHCLKED